MAPGVKDRIRRPLQTSDSSDTIGVPRFVKRARKTACASPTLFLLLPANCVFKLTSDASSTVNYGNCMACFNALKITIDRNPHFNQAFKQAM